MFSTCSSGTVLVVIGANDNLFQSNDDLLFIKYFQPLTWIFLEDDNQLMFNDLEQMLPNNQSMETVCNNLLLFVTDPCPLIEEIQVITNLLKMYNLFKDHYYFSSVVILLSEFSKNEEAFDSFLLNISQENIFLLLHKKSEIHHWMVTDNKIHKTFYENWKIENYSKFKNRHLKVATIHYPPAVILPNQGNNIEITSADGIEPKLLAMLAEYLNFTFNYKRSFDEDLWGGIHRMIIEKKADIAIGDNYMFAGRPYEMSVPYKFNHEGFILPSPKPHAKWTALVYPFSIIVWIVTLMSIAVTILILRCLANKWTERSSSTPDRFFVDTAFWFSYVIGSFLGVTQPRQINTTTVRLFIVFWLLSAATIIPTVYRSGFISRLTSPQSPRPIETIRQLSESSLGKVTVMGDWFLENSSIPYEQLLGKQMIRTNITHMMQLLGTGSWAIESSLDHLQYFVAERYPSSSKKNSFRFYILKEFFYPTRSCMLLEKDSPLKSHIDRALQRLIETGFVDYHRSKFVKKLKQFKTEIVLEPFSLDHLQGAFYVLAIGLFISFFVFVIECCIYLKQLKTK